MDPSADKKNTPVQPSLTKIQQFEASLQNQKQPTVTQSLPVGSKQETLFSFGPQPTTQPIIQPSRPTEPAKPSQNSANALPGNQPSGNGFAKPIAQNSPTQPKPPGFSKSNKLQFVVEEEPNLGVRKDMEDYTICEPDLLGDGNYSFFCILDGHGGYAVSRFVKESYPKILKTKLEGFRDAYSVRDIITMSIDNLEKQLQMIGGRDCGSTFSALLFSAVVGKCWTINIGDSRSMRVRQVAPGQFEYKQLSVDHKATNEEEVKRVEKEGGSIINGRLAGNLMITRSLGDFDFKKYGLSSVPDISERNVQANDIYIVASDGLWDQMPKEKMETYGAKLFGGSLAGTVKEMVQRVINDGSTDNISVILVKI